MSPEPADISPPNPGAKKTRGKKAVPWRDDPEILARLPEVERLHLGGATNMRIAAGLGVDETTIRRDLGRLRLLWREYAGGQVEDLKARTVQQLMEVHRRALAAAEFDEQAERAVLYGQVPDGADGTPLEVKRDHKGSAQFRGSKAASLAQARQAVMDAAKVMGIVVEKVAPTDADGKTLDLASLVTLARKRDGGSNSTAT